MSPEFRTITSDLSRIQTPFIPLETNKQISTRARRFLKPAESSPFPVTMETPGLISNPKTLYSPPKLKAPKKLVETRNLLNSQASILDENRIVLYKKGKQLG